MQHAPARGALLLVAAMATFSLSDVMAKRLAADVPPVALAWCRYLLLVATTVPLALAQPALWRTRSPGWQAARAAGLTGSAVFFLLALGALPVAEATAMVFASPLFVTLLAALLLKERVALARWAPVMLGFAGVLVVVRPGSSVFGAAALYPLASSLCWASAVACTRKLSANDASATTMLYSSLLGTAALTVILPPLQPDVLLTHGLLVAGMAGSWCVGQWLTIAAYRAASAAAIAPFAYSQLVWAAGLGVAVFGHVPDGVSLAGIGVILASGLLAAWLERRSRLSTSAGCATRAP
jgi:drug/metabolite transporter (DMT)-like permease